MRFVILLLVLLWHAPAFGAACTDGVDCLCDKTGYGVGDTTPGGATVIFCEDFENTEYISEQDGWHSTSSGGVIYGSTARSVAQCRVGGTGFPSPINVSTEDIACMNIVTEAACDVDSQTDCVYDGQQAYGAKYDQTKTHGLHGAAYFDDGAGNPAPTRTYGVTSLVKFSHNFEWGFGPGFKYWEFGIAGLNANHHGQEFVSFGTGQGPWGSGTGSLVTGETNGGPGIWAGGVYHTGLWPTQSAISVTLGSARLSNSSFNFYFMPYSGDFYSGDYISPIDSWACLRTKITGSGTNDMSMEQWYQHEDEAAEAKVINITGMEADGMLQNTPIDAVAFGNYFNGVQGTATCGYGSTSTDPCVYESPALDRAYRYEDNWIITDGDPVTCAEIGFGAAPSATPSLSGVSAIGVKFE